MDNGTKDLTNLNALIETFKFGAVELDDREEEFRLEGSTRPIESLVLVNITTICQSCGSRHETPNFKLLFRRKRKLFVATKWSSLMNRLPREVREHTENVPACKVCFNTATFTGREILAGRKRK